MFNGEAARQPELLALIGLSKTTAARKTERVVTCDICRQNTANEGSDFCSECWLDSVI